MASSCPHVDKNLYMDKNDQKHADRVDQQLTTRVVGSRDHLRTPNGTPKETLPETEMRSCRDRWCWEREKQPNQGRE